MLVKLSHPSLFVKAVEIISDLVSEVSIKINEFGLSISAIDPANVSMIGFKIPRSAFTQFESGEESLGVNLDHLKKILKRAGTGSPVTLEKQENMLNVYIEDRIKRNFSLSLIEVDSEDVDFSDKVSKMEFSSKVEINSLDLIASIEDCGVVSESCSFQAENGKFIIQAKGLNSARSEFSVDEATIEGESCKAKYSLEYLQKFMKGAKMCEKTLINFAEDHPLKIDFRVPNMELSFVLAPRVETED